MPKLMSEGTIAIVKATVPLLAEHGQAITAEMYDRLFEHEHIRALFNQSHQGNEGSQVKALAQAVLGYAANIDNLSALAPVVERIAQKHIGYNILPEHYPYVATALLGAIEHVAGEAATPDLLAAWGEAFWFLADILKGREQAIREDMETIEGGWSGWRDFRVVEKTRETPTIASFVLVPVDGRPVLAHKPGQYLTFAMTPPDGPPMKRNYSISSGPGDRSYRITVKREADGEGGSRFLHDHVEAGSVLQVAPPAGDFFLKPEERRPVVLLSGGVGLTPMVSMIEAIVTRHPDLEVHYVHGTLDGTTHAMGEHIRNMADRHARMSVTTFYAEPGRGDAIGRSHHVDGMITLEWLAANTPLDHADIYLCGPRAFLKALVGALYRAGVPASRVHYEFFGPADELIAA